MASLYGCALLAASVAATTACDTGTPIGRPAQAPGPQIVVRGATARRGAKGGAGRDYDIVTVERGERFRFAVAGTGAGTHFGSNTFLDSKAFTDLRVVAIVSSNLLWAQGTISLIASEGHKDITVVTGQEIAVDPWAFSVVPTGVAPLGAPPASGEGAFLDSAENFHVFEVVPKDSAARTVVFRVDRDPGAPPGFAPAIDLYDDSGKPLASPQIPCASVDVHSRAPIFARVFDPSHHGGPGKKFRLSAVYGDSVLCITTSPAANVPRSN